VESTASSEPGVSNNSLPSASELRAVLPAPSASPLVETPSPRPSFLQRWQSRAPRAAKKPMSSAQSSVNEVKGGAAEIASAAAIGDMQSSSARLSSDGNSLLASGPTNLTGSLNALDSSSASRAAPGLTFNATSPQIESASSQSLAAAESAEYVSSAIETVQDASLRAGMVRGWSPRGGPLRAAAWERARGAARLASAPVRSAARLASFPVRWVQPIIPESAVKTAIYRLAPLRALLSELCSQSFLPTCAPS
jgi:hypothetical protein